MGKVDLIDDEIGHKNPEMIFTDRDNPRRIFWEAYDALNKDEFFVINYHGFGGVGKSWLCKYLNDILHTHNHPHTGNKISSKSLILNFEDLKNNCEKINVLENLANKFESECNYKFPLFKYGLYVYYRTQGYSNDSPEIKRIQDNVIAGTALDIMQTVPLIGDIGSVILKSVDSLNTTIRNHVIKNSDLIKKLDSLSSEDISAELIKIFAKELRECTQKEDSPVVVFLDTYEQLQNFIYQIASAKVSEDWLWSKTGLIRRIPNVLWILAGQRQVTWGKEDNFWNDEENIIFEEIKEITDVDLLKKMLSDIGILESDIIDIMVKKTNGVPVHLALCKDTYFNLKNEGRTPTVADFDMGYTQLAKRFVGGLSSELKDIVNVLSCLESWNMSDISNLGLSADAYEYILQLSFINFDNDIYYMHHSVQEIVYKDCSKLVQSKCLKYFESRIADSSITTAEKKNYVYKKIKLEINEINSLTKPEDIKSKTALFINQNAKYVREYLYDYNFFEKVRELIKDNIPEELLGLSYGKILDIYSLYHCVMNGEYAIARHYIEEDKIISGHLKLDKDTRGFLYLALAYYESHMKNHGVAKNYLLESYEIWKDSEDIHAFLDVVARLGRTCINLNQYTEVANYSDLGIKALEGTKIDTKLAISYCELIVNKAKVERRCGNMTKALEYLKSAEEILKPFENLENEGIYFEYAVVFQQYVYIYRDVKRNDLRREAASKDLEVSRKAYEIMPSDRNYRSLAISYSQLGRVSSSYEEIKECLDKAIAIFEDIHRNQPNNITYNELFSIIRQAADCVSIDVANEYLDKCQSILNDESNFQVEWKEMYVYQRSVLLYYVNSNRYEEATQKMMQIDTLLLTRQDRLSAEDYMDYESWNYREWGNIYEKLKDYYKAIEFYEKENAVEYRLYKNYPSYSDGSSYADSCRVLAISYRDINMMGKALHYAQKQLDIDRRFLEEFQSYKTMKRYVESLKILANTYELNHELEKAMIIYEQAFKYTKSLYEGEKTASKLIDIFSIYRKTEKYKLANADYVKIEQEYGELLKEFASGNYLYENDQRRELVEKICDYLSCSIGRILYIQGIDLEKARGNIESSKCPYSNFSLMDQQFYVGKIESKLFDDYIERLYLQKNEAIKLLL